MNTRFKITNLLLFLLSVLSIVGLLLPYTSILFNGNSFYFSPMNLAYCAKAEDCRHEVAHLMDEDLGSPSKSREFGKALMTYVIYQIKFSDAMDEFSVMIFTTPGMLIYSDSYQPYKVEAGSSPQEELYARLYSKVDGDISKLPKILQPFYSTDQKYDAVYKHLIDKKIYVKRSFTMNQVKEKMKELWGKVIENKEIVLKVGFAVAGAVVGAVVTAVLINAQDNLVEEVTMSPEDDGDNEETE